MGTCARYFNMLQGGNSITRIVEWVSRNPWILGLQLLSFWPYIRKSVKDSWDYMVKWYTPGRIYYRHHSVHYQFIYLILLMFIQCDIICTSWICKCESRPFCQYTIENHSSDTMSTPLFCFRSSLLTFVILARVTSETEKMFITSFFVLVLYTFHCRFT